MLSWSLQWLGCALHALKEVLPIAAVVVSLEPNVVFKIAVVTVAAFLWFSIQGLALLTYSTGGGLFHMTRRDAHALVVMARNATIG